MVAHRWIVLASILVAGVAVAAVVLLLPGPAAAPNCTVTPPGTGEGGQSFVLAACGSTVQMGADSYRTYSVVRLSDGETLLGAYTANVSLGAYLLNTSEYSTLESNPHPASPPAGYLWSCGTTSECNLSVPIPGSPVQPYLVVENLHDGNASLTWSKTLSVYYTPTRSDAFPAIEPMTTARAGRSATD